MSDGTAVTGDVNPLSGKAPSLDVKTAGNKRTSAIDTTAGGPKKVSKDNQGGEGSKKLSSAAEKAATKGGTSTTPGTQASHDGGAVAAGGRDEEAVNERKNEHLRQQTAKIIRQKQQINQLQQQNRDSKQRGGARGGGRGAQQPRGRGGAVGRGGFGQRGSRGSRGRGRGAPQSQRGSKQGSPTYTYFPINAMHPTNATLKAAEFKVRGSDAVDLNLWYPEGSCDEMLKSPEVLVGFVASVGYTDVLVAQGRKSTHYVNTTNLAVAVGADYKGVDPQGNPQVYQAGTAIRVKIASDFLHYPDMRGHLLVGNKPTLLYQVAETKESFMREYKRIASRVLPGDKVLLVPQPLKRNPAGEEYQKFQISALLRSGFVVSNKNNAWQAVPPHGCYSVTGPSRTSERISAVYHGHYDTQESLTSPQTWAQPGVECVMKTRLGLIPNPGSKLWMNDDNRLVAVRPYDSVGEPSIAGSVYGDAPESDAEMDQMDNEFDNDRDDRFTQTSAPVDKIQLGIDALNLVQQHRLPVVHPSPSNGYQRGGHHHHYDNGY